MLRCVAFVWAYNEADIIGHVVRHLNEQGVHVHLLNNWSTDDTERIAYEYGVDRMVSSESWPVAGPVATVSWMDMLNHTALTAQKWAMDGDFWAIHHDADEIRRSQHPAETLQAFFTRIRKAGWNAVDHHVVTYCPRDGYDPQIHDPEKYFSAQLSDHFDQRNGQVKAWWQTPNFVVDLASKGGHKVMFEGRKVSPERLMLKHYPMRGEAQRAAKAASRKARWAQREQLAGWHAAYS